MKHKYAQEDLRWLYQPFVWALMIFVAALTFYWWNFSGSISADHAIWGQFGDFVGGLVNPAVGLITVLLLIATNAYQREMLRAQREELELTRQEMANSTQALNNQVSQFDDKAKKDELFNRADRVFSEIQAISRGKNYEPLREGQPTRTLFDMRSLLRRHPETESFKKNLDKGKKALRPLLPELAFYLMRIDAISATSRDATDYYRRRIQKELDLMQEIVEPEVMSNLRTKQVF